MIDNSLAAQPLEVGTLTSDSDEAPRLSVRVQGTKTASLEPAMIHDKE
jgi:hypothetical protein